MIRSLRPLLLDIVQLDRSKISLATALRNTVGVVAPLAVGALVGYTLTGLTISIGALNVAFSDREGPYRLRAGRMLLAAVVGAISAFVGSTAAAHVVPGVVITAMWGFGGGLLVALGLSAGQIGVSSIILLLVYAAYPVAPDNAAVQAALILAGGALQALLAVAAWPLRPLGPQRNALAAVFRQLAAYARTSSDPNSAPPATGEITTASTTLMGLGRDHSTGGEALRTLLDEAERIRVELLALDDAHRDLRGEGGDSHVSAAIDDVWDASADVLTILADSLAREDSPAASGEPMKRIEVSVTAIRHVPTEGTDAGMRREQLLAHVEALLGQLRACIEIADKGSAAGEEAAARAEASLPPALRLRGSIGILRANLSLQSASFRHALRLAACLAVAGTLAHALNLARPYWVPLTAAIVLKSDFTATFTRGIARIAGTMVGLALTTVLVLTVFGEVPGRVLLVGVLTFVIRSLGLANFGLSAIAITSLVVILTSFAGAPPETTIIDRGVNTLIGGALALASYGAWPTWERTQTPAILADMLAAYRRYFDVVMRGYLDPERIEHAALRDARLEARLARSNAEASIDRLAGEPGRSEGDIDDADGLMANSHRFVHSVMTLEAPLYQRPAINPPIPLQRFADDVDTTLQALELALRDPSLVPDGLPDLRADQSALVAAALRDTDGSDGSLGTSSQPLTLTSEAERITNSLNTIAYLLRRSRQNAQERPAHVLKANR